MGLGPSGGGLVILGVMVRLEVTRRFHAVTHQPMEALHKQKKSEHNGEWNIELITEDGKSEKGLCNEHPGLVI